MRPGLENSPCLLPVGWAGPLQVLFYLQAQGPYSEGDSMWVASYLCFGSCSRDWMGL